MDFRAQNATDFVETLLNARAKNLVTPSMLGNFRGPLVIFFFQPRFFCRFARGATFFRSTKFPSLAKCNRDTDNQQPEMHAAIFTDKQFRLALVVLLSNKNSFVPVPLFASKWSEFCQPSDFLPLSSQKAEPRRCSSFVVARTCTHEVGRKQT